MVEFSSSAWYSKKLAYAHKRYLQRRGFKVKMFWNGKAWSVKGIKNFRKRRK